VALLHIALPTGRSKGGSLRASSAAASIQRQRQAGLLASVLDLPVERMMIKAYPRTISAGAQGNGTAPLLVTSAGC
jgi:hypothetical protein